MKGDQDDEQASEWNVWWTGHKSKRRDGVGIAIRSNKQVNVEDIGHVSARVMWIDCQIYGMKIRVISAYAPTEEGSESQKDQFYKDLNDCCKLQDKRQLMVCGDMNATASYCTSFVGGSNCLYTNANNNGERFADFLTSNELCLSNTWFQHKKIHKDTWYSNTGNFSKTIDYISNSKWINQYVTDCRVRRSYAFNNSDHRILVCKLKTPRRKIDRKRFVKKKAKTRKYDISGLKEEYIRSDFVKNVDELCKEIECTTTGVRHCEKLKNILEEAAVKTLPSIIKSAEGKLWENDEELVKLRQSRDKVDRYTRPEEFKIASKSLRKRFDQLRNQHYKCEASKLEEAHEARNLEKLYRLSKASCTNKKPAQQVCPGLKDHFQSHFTHPDPSNEPPNEISDPPAFIKHLTESGVASENELQEIDLLTRCDEIKKNIKKLKNRKSSTDIPAEFLKAAAESDFYVGCGSH